MSNRILKLKLYEKNPFCFYCKEKMILTNQSTGSLPPKAATIEHVISRLNPFRWVRKKTGEVRKVLACYKCNQDRSILETLCLSHMEITKRRQGFSLSPHGKPIVKKPLNSIEEVLERINSARA